MDYPTIYPEGHRVDTRRLALLSVLTALCLGIQLLPRPMNLEFTSLIAFAAGTVFGSLYGSSLGALVMLANGFLSPYGFAGVVLPFQIAGMGLVGLAGGLYKRVNGNVWAFGRFGEAAILGAVLTFIYDVLTNLGTAVFLTFSGISFHEAVATALVLGAVPAAIHMLWNAGLFGVVTVPLVNAMQRIVVYGGEQT